jgi:hypothetical protein
MERAEVMRRLAAERLRLEADDEFPAALAERIQVLLAAEVAGDVPLLRQLCDELESFDPFAGQGGCLGGGAGAGEIALTLKQLGV